jgi:hypothetical protein
MLDLYPGPGHYDLKGQNFKVKKNFNLKPVNIVDPSNEVRDNIGPGTYNIRSLNTKISVSFGK